MSIGGYLLRFPGLFRGKFSLFCDFSSWVSILAKCASWVSILAKCASCLCLLLVSVDYRRFVLDMVTEQISSPHFAFLRMVSVTVLGASCLCPLL